jgi:hypothetical protein
VDGDDLLAGPLLDQALDHDVEVVRQLPALEHAPPLAQEHHVDRRLDPLHLGGAQAVEGRAREVEGLGHHGSPVFPRRR